MTKSSFALYFTLSMALLQCYIIYLSYKVWKFAKGFSPIWGRAFLIFGLVQVLLLLRRGTLIYDALGFNGYLYIIAQWADHLFTPALVTLASLFFLIYDKQWWDQILSTYIKPNASSRLLADREGVVAKREDVATEREGVVGRREDEVRKGEFSLGETAHLEAEEPEEVEVDKPSKIIVGFDEKKVKVEKPKKVSVSGPKKVVVKKAKN